MTPFYRKRGADAVVVVDVAVLGLGLVAVELDRLVRMEELVEAVTVELNTTGKKKLNHGYRKIYRASLTF